jgi:hypothetical protein
MQLLRAPLLLVLLLSILSSETSAQTYNRKMTNNKTGEEILVGLCTRNAFLKDSYRSWFLPEYKMYQNIIRKKDLDSIGNMLEEVKVKIILGTWCHDSQEHFPHFMTILDYLKMPAVNYEIICVNTQKEAVSFSIDSLNVIYVPTFIFYKNEIELGRIIETPIINLERDMLAILRKSN